MMYLLFDKKGLVSITSQSLTEKSVVQLVKLGQINPLTVTADNISISIVDLITSPYFMYN